MKKLIVTAVAFAGLSLSASAAVFNISMRVDHNATGGRTNLIGTVDVNDTPTVSGDSIKTHTFSLNSLTLSNSEVSESWDAAELSSYSMRFNDFGASPIQAINFHMELPLPLGVFGLKGRHELSEGAEWASGLSPFGAIEVSDIAVVADYGNRPDPIGGGSSFGLEPVRDNTVVGHTYTKFTAVPSETIPITVAKVKFKLTESYTAPALMAKDEMGKKIKDVDRVYSNSFQTQGSTKFVSTTEYGSKLNKLKISNKQILEALQEAGEIPSISGWSIVVIEGEDRYLAVTDEKEYIDISNYITISDKDGYAETFNEKSVHTVNESGYAGKITSSGKGKQLVAVAFELADSSGMLNGVANWSVKYKADYDTWISGSSSIKSLSGYFRYEGDTSEDDSTVIEGSISTSKAKVLEDSSREI